MYGLYDKYKNLAVGGGGEVGINNDSLVVGLRPLN